MWSPVRCSTSLAVSGVKRAQPYILRRHNASGMNASSDIRGRLTTELKTAMKARDAFTLTTIRSVLAEIHGADKSPSGTLSDSDIVSIIRKAAARRTDAATQFASASRPDLAEAEVREANLLSKFLPSLLPQEDIDRILSGIISAHDVQASDPKKATGTVLKKFYGKVDKSLVDGHLVKQRVELLLSGRPA